MTTDLLQSGLTWSGATFLAYVVAKRLALSFSLGRNAPLILTLLLLSAITQILHVPFTQYMDGAHWLMLPLGPCTVAFALSIHRHRGLIRHQWAALTVGIIVGSGTAMGSSWGLAKIFNLDPLIVLSLIPRSISTPFALTFSADIGGHPELTATFVCLTGILATYLGTIIIQMHPSLSPLTRGAILGMGAHAIGVHKAHDYDPEDGAFAGLVMVCAGIANVIAAPVVTWILA